MTDAPAADLRDIIAVQTVYFRLRHKFQLLDPTILELAMLIENHWLRHTYPDADTRHVEAACRRYISCPDSFPNLEVQP